MLSQAPQSAGFQVRPVGSPLEGRSVAPVAVQLQDVEPGQRNAAPAAVVPG